MKHRLALTSICSLLVCATAAANNFSVSGPGGAIPDCPNSPGAWNMAPTWGVLTSTVNLLNPVKSITKVTLSGLTHTYRGDVHAFLTDPAGVRYNVLVRAGFNGTNSGDSGNYNAGNYDFVQSGGGTVAQGTIDINGGTYNQYLNTGAGMWTSGSYVINNTPLNSITGPAGTWTLTVVDWYAVDTGSLTGWTLEGTDTPDPGTMYWVSAATNTIHRANLDGTADQDLATTFKDGDGQVALDVQGGKMYWTSAATNTIHRANLDGTSEQDLLAGSVAGVERISLDTLGGKMYWDDAATNTIHRANLDGSSEQDLLLSKYPSSGVVTLDPAGGKMYWTDAITQNIHSANLDGTSPQDLLLQAGPGAEHIALDTQGGKLYWPNIFTTTIHRANLDGTSEQDLGGDVTVCCSGPFCEVTNVSLDVPGGKMYWADFTTSTIHRANLDGTSPQNLLVGLVGGWELISLDLQGGKMYWSDSGTNTIHRANLDGTAPQDLGNLTGAACGAHVSLAHPREPTMVQTCLPGQGGIQTCPCGNPPAGGGLGCNNFGAGPADSGTLTATGIASLSLDDVVLVATGENDTSLSVFWSGQSAVAPPGAVSGAGLRCVQTNLKRLYIGSALGGAISRPGMGDPTVSARTAAAGAPISVGQTRYYYMAYRDPLAAVPCGDSSSNINTSNAGSILWGF